MLAAEAPGNVTLKLPGGVEFPLLRRDIKAMKTLPTSLMPEGLESVITGPGSRRSAGADDGAMRHAWLY